MATPRERALSTLVLANEHRLRRSAIRAEVTAGTMTIAEAIEDPAVATALVVDVLMWTHRRGRYQARRDIHTIGCTEAQTVRALTDRQREILAGL